MIHVLTTMCMHTYIHTYALGSSGVTLSNVTLPNNLLLNSYFETLTVGLYILYVFNMHANFYTNQMLFTI